jgi:hypothetical protein
MSEIKVDLRCPECSAQDVAVALPAPALVGLTVAEVPVVCCECEHGGMLPDFFAADA